MASDPSELGDEAAGDELGGVSFMLHRRPGARWRGWRVVEGRRERGKAMEGDGRRQQ
jgi:hypothetical protein